MSFLRGSTNYVWCTTNVLGKGATGAVYQGVHKNNGEPVAVKTFNQLSQMRPPDVQVREFEVLKKVKHENIVKLLAIEEDQEGRGKVIVMELCTGGSLFNILDDPENTYGLQEEEFLLVLEHLTAGMKHLRDNNLIHRDLKPGNIMKFITDDGRTVYKLTDFGAARELEEDQQFMSLYGTEEYLHPDMYERAVLRKPVGKTFGATVDLWSIGVTLYHVATGNLPFRPFGGRKNKETMYYITTKKASGVISGCQTSESGPIEWSRELPDSCQLSRGLKKIITPLLAGLLEVDAQRIWSFDRFFSEVTGILSRKLIHLFHVNRTHSVRIYLHPEDTYDQFQSLIMEQTEVSPASQIIIFQEKHLLSYIETSTLGRGYPNTRDDDPIMLFSRENNNVTAYYDVELPKFPTFPNLVSVENDASLAKSACSVGHAFKRRIERLHRSCKLTHMCAEQFSAVVCQSLDNVCSQVERAQEVTRHILNTVSTADRAQHSVKVLLQMMGKSMDDAVTDWQLESSAVTRELQSGLAPAATQLRRRCVADGALRREWTSAAGAPPSPGAPARAATLVSRLRDSWQHLLRDRAARNLTYNEEQFHALERVKVAEAAKRLRYLLEKEVSPVHAHIADCLADWYKMAQTVFLQAEILAKDVACYSSRLDTFATRLHDEDTSFHSRLQEIIEQGKDIPYQMERRHRSSSGRYAVLRSSLKDALAIQDEVAQILTENADLVKQFQQLIVSNGKDGDILLS
ncbi:serine/threonine-protein kinase TBK1 [Schistocerca piceifrons]|uniref:serine/threonine-protein kinase TBK1 n=1 Tax=Schistocerca piceifrons TaxID=274613 RepID=UPI001F5E4723|nr:serine/threonine-protein kinase TBK1 [Schistocerca piceifrons]